MWLRSITATNTVSVDTTNSEMAVRTATCSTLNVSGPSPVASHPVIVVIDAVVVLKTQSADQALSKIQSVDDRVILEDTTSDTNKREREDNSIVQSIQSLCTT